MDRRTRQTLKAIVLCLAAALVIISAINSLWLVSLAVTLCLLAQLADYWIRRKKRIAPRRNTSC